MAETGILISDFDGTLTDHDFFDLVRQRWPIPAESDPWNQYWAGQITHFEALAQIFAGIRTEPAVLEALVEETHLAPGLAGAVEKLRAAGWELAIASAGCGWYIDRLLAGVGVEVIVHANPGRVEPNGALLMNRPAEGPFYSASTGVDKLAIVRSALRDSAKVAFAGDGRPDLEPALLVPPERRFARGWLAGALAERGEKFHHFKHWPEIVETLTC